MSTTLATTITVNIGATFTNSLDLASPVGTLAHRFSDSLANGTSANQSDLIFWDTRSLAATSENLDLAGSLTDAFGNTLTFADITCLYIENNNTTAGQDLLVGGAASAQFVNWVADASDIVKVRANGILLLWAPMDGYAVTATTADLLKIDAGANTVSYDIILVGTSA